MTDFDMYYPKPSFALSSKKNGKRNSQDDRTPKHGKKAFNCPHCGAYAQQEWETWKETPLKSLPNQTGKLETAQCQICNNYSIWRMIIMIYPLTSPAPKPDDNMPPKVKKIYEEARLVSICSPRAAAALLRVALEELTAHLGETEDALYKQIRRLYKRDFPAEVIQMFDIVRITANKGGAHSGKIDLTGKDGEEVVNTLFFLVNHIVEIAITTSKKIKQEYEKIPKELREQIAKDDKPKDKT